MEDNKIKEADVCLECLKRGKTWNGNDPVCAFSKAGSFDSNYQCATLNKLRENLIDFYKYGVIMEEAGKTMNCLQNRGGIYTYNIDDQWYVRIDLGYVGLDYKSWLFEMSWYKSRGAVDEMWIHPRDNTQRVRRPTEQEVLAINDYVEHGVVVSFVLTEDTNKTSASAVTDDSSDKTGGEQ